MHLTLLVVLLIYRYIFFELKIRESSAAQPWTATIITIHSASLIETELLLVHAHTRFKSLILHQGAGNEVRITVAHNL
jgi:hypothetical protein